MNCFPKHPLQISLRLVTLLASHLSTAVASTTPLDVADPSVNKTEPSVTGQEIDSRVIAGTQASSEQPNGVATNEDLTKHTDEIGLLKSPVAQQGESDKPVGVSASSLVCEKSVSSLEMLKASSEEPSANEKAVPVEEQTKEMAVGAKEFINQKSEHTSVQLTVFEDKPDPVHCGPKDVNETSVAVEATGSPSTKKESKNCGQASTQYELMPIDLIGNIATQNKNSENKELVTCLSKAVQAEGNARCDGPPLSTQPVTGWSFHSKMYMLHMFLYFCTRANTIRNLIGWNH